MNTIFKSILQGEELSKIASGDVEAYAAWVGSPQQDAALQATANDRISLAVEKRRRATSFAKPAVRTSYIMHMTSSPSPLPLRLNDLMRDSLSTTQAEDFTLEKP